MNDRGSEWSQWDLHIHTPFSHLANKYKASPDEFNTAVIDSPAAVIGITNYFNISSDEYNNCVLPISKVKTVFLNFEFRISQTNKDGEFINLHVVFGNLNRYNDIILCLGRIPLVRPSSEPQLYCNDKDLAKIGYDKAVIEFGQLVTQLKKDFKEKQDYVLILTSY